MRQFLKVMIGYVGVTIGLEYLEFQ